MIDLHCHLLPGIDDGPRTVEESVALARVAAARGTDTIVATSHASARYPNGAATTRRLTAEVNERLRAEAIPVQALTGMEVAMSHVEEIEPEELRQMTLGDGPWLLLEPPFLPIVVGLDRLVAVLQGQGYGVVLAHPERCPAFHRDPSMLPMFVNAGVLTSITAGSLTGRFGKTVKRFALRLSDEGLVHNVASDAHDTLRRPPGIADELAAAGLSGLAAWLTEEVPGAILQGMEIPPRPSGPARSGRGAGMRRRLGSWRGARP